MVVVFGERGGGDIGDVVNVDKGLGLITSRQGDHAAEDHVDKGAFGEILVEPACPHDRPFEAGRDHDSLAGLGFLFAAAGQEDQPLDAAPLRQVDKGLDRILRARHGKVGCVGDVDRRDTLEARLPAFLIVPVKGRDTRA